MGGFKNFITRLMYGRYGMDKLNLVVFAACLLLLVANLFVNSVVIRIVAWVLTALLLLRAYSRNLYKRREENRKFLKVWNPLEAKASITIKRIREIGTHRYRRCPACKAMLRLPRRKGKHSVDCPRCKHEFRVRIIW